MTDAKTRQLVDVPAPGIGKSAIRAEFIDWFLTPGRQGTQQSWAQEHGVDQSTLSDWKRGPEFAQAAASYRTAFKPRFVEATMTMLDLAVRGNVNAYRAVADVLGENAPQKVDLTSRMTLTDFLSKATFPVEPVVRLS